jgi:hypothetical protein
MPSKIKNKNGFGFPFLLIVTFITFVIAAAGWYVYSQKYNVVDSRGVAGIIKTVDSGGDITSDDNYEYLGDFSYYNNQQLGISFEYPKDWLVKEVNDESKQAGIVFDLVSPQQHDDYLKGDTKVDSDLFISFWQDINNEYALGGDWQGRRTYLDMADYLTSPEFGYKKSLRIVNSQGYDVHFVTIGGQGESYGVMVQNAKGIYEFNFASTLDEKSASPQVKRIVQSIKISEN